MVEKSKQKTKSPKRPKEGHPSNNRDQTTPKKQQHHHNNNSSTHHHDKKDSKRRSVPEFQKNNCSTPPSKAEFFAGAQFQNSPEPSALPIPVFKKKAAVSVHSLIENNDNTSTSPSCSYSQPILSRSVDSNTSSFPQRTHHVHHHHLHPQHQMQHQSSHPHGGTMNQSLPHHHHHHNHSHISSMSVPLPPWMMSPPHLHPSQHASTVNGAVHNHRLLFHQNNSASSSISSIGAQKATTPTLSQAVPSASSSSGMNSIKTISQTVFQMDDFTTKDEYVREKSRNLLSALANASNEVSSISAPASSTVTPSIPYKNVVDSSSCSKDPVVLAQITADLRNILKLGG